MPTLDLEKLLRIPSVEPGGFDIAPDGRKVVFAWNRTGQWEIYEAGLDRPGEILQLTGGPGGKFAPKYSPNGHSLGYALDLDGSESFDLWRLDFDTQRHTNLTPDTPFALQPNFAWSPDGAWLACLADRDGTFETYLLASTPDPAGQPPELHKVCSQGGPNWTVVWSPDGRRLAMTAEGQAQDYFTYVIELDAGEASHPCPPARGGEGSASTRQEAIQALRAWPVAWEGHPINAKEVCWAPDGKRLAFSSDIFGRYQIGLLDVENGVIDWSLAQAASDLSALGTTGSPIDQGTPDWSPDGQRLAYVTSQGPETWLTVQHLGEPAVRHLQLEPGLHALPQFIPGSGGLVFVFDSPRRPDDLWRLDLDSGAFTQLTHSLPPELSPADFVMPEHIWYDSLDGRKVPALLYNGRAEASPGQPSPPRPALVVIHGGPTWLFQYLWYPVMAHCASRGWVVLAPNYRGSSGYGREWQYANRFEMGCGDTMDVAAGVDFLIDQGLADPRRIGVTGRSHGGFLTMSCLTEYPQKFAVGSAVVPFLNWFTSHAASREDLQHWDIENMGDPVEQAELWRRCSPYFFLERIQAPVQLIGGANDPRCPVGEAVAARDALLALGKPVELLLYEDEGHTFLKTENVVDHELRRVAFLANILESSC